MSQLRPLKSLVQKGISCLYMSYAFKNTAVHTAEKTRISYSRNQNCSEASPQKRFSFPCVYFEYDKLQRGVKFKFGH